MKLLVAVATAAALAAGCAPKHPHKDSALKSCTDLMRAAAKNPSSADIPAPSTHSTSNSGQYLEWKHGDGLRFMNDMGAKLDSSAKCFTSANGEEVETLYVDRERLQESARDRILRESIKLNQSEREQTSHASQPRIEDAAQAAVDAAAAADAAAANN